MEWTGLKELGVRTSKSDLIPIGLLLSVNSVKSISRSHCKTEQNLFVIKTVDFTQVCFDTHLVGPVVSMDAVRLPISHAMSFEGL